MGVWLLFAIPGAIVTTLTGWVFFGKGKNARAIRRSAQRGRKRLWMGTKTRAKATHKYYRDKRAATPRGQLKAKRRSQPNRWTWGNVRTADDPTRSRRAVKYAGTHAKAAGTGVLGKVKAAGTAVRNRRRLRKANAAPSTKPTLKQLASTKMSNIAHGAPAASSSARGGNGPRCGAPTQDGSPCQNTCMDLGGGVYAGSCWIPRHKAHSAQTGAAMAAQQRAAQAKAAPKQTPQPTVYTSAKPPTRPVAPTGPAAKPAPKPPASDIPKAPKLTPAPKRPAESKPLVTDRDEPVARPPVFNTTNVASSGFTPAQVGVQMNAKRAAQAKAKPQASGGGAADRLESWAKDTAKKPPTAPKAKPATSGNHAGPGAQVGVQADNVVGGINVTMAGRDINTGNTTNHSAGDMFISGGKAAKAPKAPKPAKDKAPNSADVDQSTTTTHVAGRRVTTDGTMNITRRGD